MQLFDQLFSSESVNRIKKKKPLYMWLPPTLEIRYDLAHETAEDEITQQLPDQSERHAEHAQK